jgi:hypothetical protein
VTKRAISDEQRRAMAAGRAASGQRATKPTTKPGSEHTKLRPGHEVEVISGRSASRQGRVTSLNRQTFPSGTTYVEIGVRLGTGTSWFRDDELRRLVL